MACKPRDNKEIVRWANFRGMPRISANYWDFAKKLPPSSERLHPYMEKYGSVRIQQEIKENNRMKTPKPASAVWQAKKTPSPPAKHNAIMIRRSPKQPKSTRIASAPINGGEYTLYNQDIHPYPQNHQQEENLEQQQKFDKWARQASSYEKQVVLDMLKSVSPHQPPYYDSKPPVAPRPKSVALSTASPTKSPRARKINSAPLKHSVVVSKSLQQPPRDQRIYRLNGEDHRIAPPPHEERRITGYYNTMQGMTNADSALSPHYVNLNVPMHGYLPQRKSKSKDYQCDVSFFQSVNAPFRSHFIIHPDFSSEHVMKRKPVSHHITHFRY